MCFVSWSGVVPRPSERVAGGLLTDFRESAVVVQKILIQGTRISTLIGDSHLSMTRKRHNLLQSTVSQSNSSDSKVILLTKPDGQLNAKEFWCVSFRSQDQANKQTNPNLFQSKKCFILNGFIEIKNEHINLKI